MRHACRRAHFSEPPGQRAAPIGAAPRVGHDGAVRVTGGLVTGENPAGGVLV
jgi:hypothetical protein